MAGEQGGVVGWGQLRGLGLGAATVRRWVGAGRLHRVHPGVYAVGHPRLALAGRLHAALLYAGPVAVLSHTTAASVWGLVEARPRRLHVSVAGQVGSRPGVRVHHTRRLERAVRDGLALTPVPRTLLDLASVVSAGALRRALAEADYRELADRRAIERVLGRGRPGSAALREALERHLPELAATRSALEQRFLLLCERSGIELPRVNVRVEGMLVDALWSRQRLVVELDGQAAHGPAARVAADRDRELRLRRAGYVILRYAWRQVVGSPELVVAELRSIVAPG